MNHYTFIVNPKAGRRGKNIHAVKLITAELNSRGIGFEVLYTQHQGHATELARASQSECVVAIGGDGTANEVANGIVGTHKTMGVIPTGSGNDLIKSLNIPNNISGALAKLLVGKKQEIDCGRVRCEQLPSSTNSTVRYFVNGVGIGFDAAVAERTTHMKHLTGTILYMVAVFQTLGTYKSPLFVIKQNNEVVELPKLLIAIGNGRCAGGGFYLTPDAVMDDGLLDICEIDKMSVPQILWLMPKVMRGKHGTATGVRLSKSESVDISSSQYFYVHADGEIVGRNVNRVSAKLVKKALNAIVG